MHGGWENYPIKETFEEAFGKPAFVDNDVNIMAMAEYEAENTHNDGNFLFVKLGTGIGCGIFCGGKIYRGASGCAGDIGHISIEGNDDLCACGNRGCLENLAGGAAIQKRIQWMAQNGKSDFLASCLAKNEPITCRTLGAGILAQDVACKEFVYQTGLYIGEVMAKLVNFYNPSMVVFGGRLDQFGRSPVYGYSGKNLSLFYRHCHPESADQMQLFGRTGRNQRCRYYGKRPNFYAQPIFQKLSSLS